MSLDIADLEVHRASLTGHCYRMLGSASDAEDAVQETMVRAWRSLGRFEGRASLRTWLHRIATNVCLDALSSDARRWRSLDERPAGTVDSPLETLDRTHWLEPVPEARVLPSDADPFETTVLRQSIRLAFVAALQHLPARQRAALLLTEVLGWSAAEVAECLETSVASVNSALQRARATLASRNVPMPAELTSDQRSVVDRYVDAFEQYDVDRLVALMRDDVTMSMPPYTLWLRGRESIRGWLVGPGSVCRPSRLVPVKASGAPAFAHYHGTPDGKWQAWAIIVLDLAGDRIREWNAFLDTATLFPLFGQPLVLD
jgi:RNA polymerase sigma-70 factor, ECF subfamily